MLAVALAFTSHFSVSWPLFGLVPAAAYLAWRLACPEPRCLRWDGLSWHLHDQPGTISAPPGASESALDDAAPVQLSLVFDLGFWVLLRASRPDSPFLIYLPLTRSTQAGNWGAMRAVLYRARQKPD